MQEFFGHGIRCSKAWLTSITILTGRCGTTNRLLHLLVNWGRRRKGVVITRLLILLLTCLSGLWLYFSYLKQEGTANTCLTCGHDQAEKQEQPETESQTSTIPLLVHLDLKGAPPTFAYLKEFIPFARSLGATGLLLEYEDTFPFDGNLRVLRSSSFVYTRTEVESLTRLAASLGMDVIPLVQTFGHLEFVLKHERFAGLREEEKNDWSICPLRLQSVSLLHEMIDQVLSLHPNSHYLHIGADEVTNMGRCERCQPFVVKHGRKKLFMDHVLATSQYVKKRWPHVRPIFWDDMVRSWPAEDLKALTSHADPMVWCYTDHIAWAVSVKDLSKILDTSPGVWLASSFKGSDKEDSNYVPLLHHVNNVNAWLEVMGKVNSLSSLRGFVLTGWSRFNHHERLCELLPSGMPSLAICLAMMKNGGLSPALLGNVSAKLGYSSTIPLENVPAERPSSHPFSLQFPGHKVFEVVEQLTMLNRSQDAIAAMKVGKEKTEAVRMFLEKIRSLTEHARHVLPEVYSSSVAAEWIAVKMLPLEKWANANLLKSKAV